MPLLFSGDKNYSVSSHLLAISAGAPINITPTDNANEWQLTFAPDYSPEQDLNPPIGRKIVFALANSRSNTMIRPLPEDEGLPTSGPPIKINESSDAALVAFDQHPNPQSILVAYYADSSDFTVEVFYGTDLDWIKWEDETPMLMLMHVLSHAYLLVSGQYDPATSEREAIKLENIFRSERSLNPRRPTGEIKKAAREVIYDLGGCEF